MHIERSFSIVLFILAIHKAGAAFVVLDKGLPKLRKQAILRVAEASTLITDSPFGSDFLTACEQEPAVIESQKLLQQSQEASEVLPAIAHSPGDLAYSKCENRMVAVSQLTACTVVFTSGSTGTPKAIMVEQSNLSHYVSAARSVVSVGPGSRVLQFATFAFDASVLEWAVSLSYGATLCFVKNPTMLVGEYLADVIDANKINFFHTTPSVLATIPQERQLPSLSLISVGGEACSGALLASWRKRLRLLHAYGPTETT